MVADVMSMCWIRVSHNNKSLTANFYKLQEENENENVGTNGDVGEVG